MDVSHFIEVAKRTVVDSVLLLLTIIGSIKLLKKEWHVGDRDRCSHCGKSTEER